MNSRELARRVLARVDEGAYATLALGGELGRARGLSPPDRALATELVYGVLKQRRRLDYALETYAARGLDLDARAMDALRLGAYQILFLRVPDHAAVDDAVEAVKRLRGSKVGGFVNALLRRLGREGEPAPPSNEREQLEVVCSAPRWLVDEAMRQFAAPEARAFLESLNAPAPLWLRTNTLRISREALVARLCEERPDARITPSQVVPEAVRAESLGDPSSLRAFAEGLFTVQDAAAQRVTRLVDPQPNDRLLDACAGVGGKSTYLAALAQNRASIDAADLSERKLELGSDAARRLGCADIHPVACDLTDPRAPLAPSYDRVLLDAPCTGLGVLRRHPEAKWRRAPGDVAALAELQAQILAALAPRVRETLVYSVCTFTDEEGPLQLAAFLAAQPDFAVEGEPLRSWPHRDDSDAFFAVRLRRLR